jgi:oxygen-independent coproporphyrinogen-3 oxidase
LYWQGGEYFGCGPSAHSHRDGKRFGNISDLAAWSERMTAGRRPFDETEQLAPEEKARETLVMWLRMTGGVDLAAFQAVTGFSVDVLCGEVIASLVEAQLLERADSRLALAPGALFICNSVFSELV